MIPWISSTTHNSRGTRQNEFESLQVISHCFDTTDHSEKVEIVASSQGIVLLSLTNCNISASASHRRPIHSHASVPAPSTIRISYPRVGEAAVEMGFRRVFGRRSQSSQPSPGPSAKAARSTGLEHAATSKSENRIPPYDAEEQQQQHPGKSFSRRFRNILRSVGSRGRYRYWWLCGTIAVVATAVTVGAIAR
jgi:hypothetical protein